MAAAPLTSLEPELLAVRFPGALEAAFPQGERAQVPVLLRPLQLLQVGLRVQVPGNAKRGSPFTVDLLQKENGKVAGGVAPEVRGF